MKITLVDTPGSNDMERSDAEVLREIADWTSKTYRDRRLLSGIIYLHPITDTRLKGFAIRNLRMFQNLCGKEVLENVFLTTTQWSNFNPAEGQAREDHLQEDGLWGGRIGKGATLQRFHGTRESGFELIHKLIANTELPLDIQKQIVEQNMTLLETNAGKCINRELTAQRNILREEVDSLRNRSEDSMRPIGRDMENLRKEQTAMEMLKRAEAGIKVLTELHATAVKMREAEERMKKAKTCDQAVIAVTTRDITISPSIKGVLTSYTTRGRLILDMENGAEFESDTFEITINYKPGLIASVRALAHKSREGFNPRVGEIVLDGGHYRCKHGGSLRVGSEEFVIFNKS